MVSTAAMRFLLVLSLGIAAVLAVKQEDFKQCGQSSFCRRLKAIASRQEAAPKGAFVSPYSLGSPIDTPGASDASSWTWPMRSSLYPEIQFDLRVDVLEQGDGIVRVRVDEVGSKTPLRRYNETAKWALLDESPRLSSSAKLSSTSERSTITYGAGLSLEVQHAPFRITQLRDGRPEIVLNERSLFHMEHFRIKEQESAEELLGEGAQTVLKGGELDRSWFEEADADMFEEQWKKWRDSKPKGESCE